MKSLLIALGITFALSLTIQAAEGKKKHTAKTELKVLKKELIQKYDGDKDGKLTKAEKAKISTEDREKMDKAGAGGKAKRKKDKANK